MKKFNEFLDESIVIKLRGNSSKSKESANAFLDELDATSKPHPFDNRHRIINDNASVDVSHSMDGGIHLHDINTLAPRSGAGTAALKHLTKLADKHNVDIEGHAKAYNQTSKDKISKTSQLTAWYKKHGFKIGEGDAADGYHIRYSPKRPH